MNADALEAIEDQVTADGIAAITVKDGTVFYFTQTLLSQLLEAAESSGSGRAILFVKRREVV